MVAQRRSRGAELDFSERPAEAATLRRASWLGVSGQTFTPGEKKKPTLLGNAWVNKAA